MTYSSLRLPGMYTSTLSISGTVRAFVSVQQRSRGVPASALLPFLAYALKGWYSRSCPKGGCRPLSGRIRYSGLLPEPCIPASRPCSSSSARNSTMIASCGSTVDAAILFQAGLHVATGRETGNRRFLKILLCMVFRFSD